VIDACCNSPFTDLINEGQLYDYWQYCTNKSCIHHGGEGIGHDWADWVERENNNHLASVEPTLTGTHKGDSNEENV
jgi:hypothetical protein